MKTKQTQVSTAVVATLAYTTLSSTDKAQVQKIVKAGAVRATATANIQAAMLALFPTKKAVCTWSRYKPVMASIKEECNNTDAYRVARTWVKATYGGLPGADGKIRKPGTSGKGMTLGRFASALDSKFEAIIGYVAKVPKDEIEPAALELLTSMVEQLTATQEQFAAYILAEKEAAEA